MMAGMDLVHLELTCLRSELMQAIVLDVASDLFA